MYCIPNEKFDNNCVSVLLRFCHCYKEWILSIYQIFKTLDKDAEMAKRNLFVTFKTKLQSKINLGYFKVQIKLWVQNACIFSQTFQNEY